MKMKIILKKSQKKNLELKILKMLKKKKKKKNKNYLISKKLKMTLKN